MSTKARLARAIALAVFTLALVPVAANAAPPKNARWYTVDMQPARVNPHALFVSQASDGVRLQGYRSGDVTQQWTPYRGTLLNRASGRCLAFGSEPGFARVTTRPCASPFAAFIAPDLSGGYGAFRAGGQCMDSLSHAAPTGGFLVLRACMAPKDKALSYQRFRLLQAG